MKTFKSKSLLILALCLGLGSACSSFPGGNSGSGDQLAVTGPTVLNARTVPSTIELSTDLRPQQPAEVLADVKDFNSQIKDVKLRFIHAPLEIPMKNIGGTTWRATLSPEQLKMLAVSGKTMNYDADIIAQNDAGQFATTDKPVEISIKTPENLTVSTG